MAFNVSPTGSMSPPAKPLLSPEVREKAKDALKGMPRAVPPESNVIEQRLEVSEKLDELAAGIPGAPNIPETGLETEVKGSAVIAAGKNAEKSIQEKCTEGVLGKHTISKEHGLSAEKIHTLFLSSTS
jgi:hypothetical protein